MSVKSKDGFPDDENPEWTEQDFAGAKLTADILPQLARRRGAQKAPTKVRTTIRLDSDVVTYFKSTGTGWQTRLNEALRREMKSKTAG